MDITTENQERKRIIQQRFDDALLGHMARLVGKDGLPVKLPLNFLNVSCLVLMAEQQANEEKQFSLPEDRYTRESLFQELAEIGLDSEDDFEAMLQQMCELEYLHMDASGLIEGQEPARQVAGLIDSILPQMPGLNLIAYIAQTIDEAVSGRKDLNDAVDQFDQTLMQQDIPAGKGEPKAMEKRPEVPAAGPSVKRRDQDRKEPKSKSRLSAADYDSLQQALKKHAASSLNTSGQNIISSSGRVEKIDVQVLSFGAPPPEPEAKAEEKLAGETIPWEEISGDALVGGQEDGGRKTEDGERKTEDEGRKTEDGERKTEDGGRKTEDGGRRPEDGGRKTEDEGRKTEDGGRKTEDGRWKTEYGDRKTDVGTSGKKAAEDGGKGSGSGHEQAGDAEDINTIEPEDDIIESRINAFEDNLSMQCPICISGEITAEKTAKKKTYYKCLNRACNFISWGKPYHKVCPRCQNPFLVEQERNHRTILKCPRSTCDHWQAGSADQTADTPEKQPTPVNSEKSKPRRRVVKRRVVRRKKA